MHISALGKVEEIQFNTELTGVEKLQCCPPASPTWFSLISKEIPKCFQKRARACRRDDRSMAVAATGAA